MRGFSHRRGAANPPPPQKNASSPGPAPAPGSSLEAGAGFGRCRFPVRTAVPWPRGRGSRSAALFCFASSPRAALGWGLEAELSPGVRLEGSRYDPAFLSPSDGAPSCCELSPGAGLPGRMLVAEKTGGGCEEAMGCTVGRGGGVQRSPSCSRCPFVCVCSFCRPASAFSRSCSFLS